MKPLDEMMTEDIVACMNRRIRRIRLIRRQIASMQRELHDRERKKFRSLREQSATERTSGVVKPPLQLQTR